MSLWELAACVAGFNRANTPSDQRDKTEPPTAAEHFAALRRVAAHGSNGS